MPLYFIAILAPTEVNQQILEWKRFMLDQFGCKKALRLPAHITLIPPFDMQYSIEMPLAGALGQLARHQSAFTVHLKNFSAFAPKVIYVYVEPDIALSQLKKQVQDLLLDTIRLPIKEEKRSFQPHITIASRDLKGKDFTTAWTYFQGRTYKAAFEAGSISLLVEKGTGWELAAEFPFGLLQ